MSKIEQIILMVTYPFIISIKEHLNSSMVKPNIYKGIEFVRLNELPEVQKRSIIATLNKDLIIKILINGLLCDDCIQYKDYKYWFENVFVRDESDEKPKDISKVN